MNLTRVETRKLLELEERIYHDAEHFSYKTISLFFVVYLDFTFQFYKI